MLMAAGTPSCATVAAELPRYGTSSGSTIGGNVNPYPHHLVSISKLQVGRGWVGGVLGRARMDLPPFLCLSHPLSPPRQGMGKECRRL